MIQERYINPYTDFGFKKLFGTELNKDLLMSFLNSLFSGQEVIREVSYLNSEHFGDAYLNLIVRGTANGMARFYPTTTSVTLTNNKLQGTGGSTHDVAANETYCFTTNEDDLIGFYLATAGTYAANKAFLPASVVSRGRNNARKFVGIDFGSEETAIKRIETSLKDGTYYNLAGQPVPHPTKGLYILNGRKVMRR